MSSHAVQTCLVLGGVGVTNSHALLLVENIVQVIVPIKLRAHICKTIATHPLLCMGICAMFAYV